MKKGIYEHYKGKRYRVIGVAKHSETLEEFIVYECLYDNNLSHLWIRPLHMFLETIRVAGHDIPRFRYIGP